MGNAGKRGSGLASSVPEAAVVSSVLAFNLAVIGPHTVWAWNANEYATSFWNVFAYLAALGVLLTLLFTVALALVPRVYRFRAVTLMFALSGLAWLQGNGLLGAFGLLDGGGLDIDGFADTRLRDAFVWVGGIGAAWAFVPRVRRHIPLLAGTFLGLQLISLPLGDPRTNPEDSTAPLPLVPPDEIFTFSRAANFVLVILDTITSDTFVQFADRDPDRFDRAYAGFTLYPDTTGAFPSTQYGLPVILGAAPYDNRIPVEDYLHRALQRDAITVRLLENGIDVDWVSAWPLFCRIGRYSSCYAIPLPYGNPAVHHKQMAAELFDISVFRHVPADAKRWVYNDGNWRAQALLWDDAETPVFVRSASDFYRDFSAKIRVGRDNPTFKIIHTGGGHGPFVLDPECGHIPSQPYNAANYERQVRCSLKQTEAFLQRLKELGIYDAATIVVASDHGASFGARGWGSHGLTSFRLSRARPLLAVKWPNSAGGLARSPAPASVQDIAPTLAAAAGIAADFPGRDLAKLASDAERRRPYGLYVQRKGTPSGYLERVERYTVGRESRRPSAWSFDGAVFSPAIPLGAKLIDPGAPESAAHFSYLGWARSVSKRVTSQIASAIGPVATVFIALPRGESVELQARLRASPWTLPQTVAVEVNGVRVALWQIESSNFRHYSATIPGSAIGEQTTAINFRPKKIQLPGSQAPPASAFDLDWIRFAHREVL